jgi:prepilin-type N-terminal cleavage/methylation domain-containing protein
MGIEKLLNTIKKDNGFSLIEVLIAISVMALSMLATASMQFSAVRNNTTGNVCTQANMLAQDKMEELIGTLEATKTESELAQIVDGEDPSLLDADGNPGGIFKRRWSLGDPWGSEQSRRLTVTVEWSRMGRTRSVEISSNAKQKELLP